MSTSVCHQPERHRFVLPVDGEEVVLEYNRTADAIDFYRTFTPPSQRGKGLARQVVDAGFEFARSEGLRIVPSCSYVAWCLEHQGSKGEESP